MSGLDASFGFCAPGAPQSFRGQPGGLLELGGPEVTTLSLPLAAVCCTDLTTSTGRGLRAEGLQSSVIPTPLSPEVLLGGPGVYTNTA